MLKKLVLAFSIIASGAFADTMQDFETHINTARTQAGLNALHSAAGLTCTARLHATDIGEKRICSVNPSDGSSVWDLAKKCGTSSYGMIIGCGYRSPEDTVRGWMERQDTRELLLNPAYRDVGVAMLNNFWVVFFGW